MCEITFVDCSPDVLPKNFIPMLTNLNSLLDINKDGFGYYLIDTNKLVKTKECAPVYWRRGFDKFMANESIRGLYHVRRASTVNAKMIDDKFSHPFMEDNLVLVHNGTLTERWFADDKKEVQELFKEKELIDSQKFLKVLIFYKKKNNNILDENVIKKALDYFDGPFAIVIYDIKTKLTWIVRGSTKLLHGARFMNKKVPVGMILNTNFAELEYIRELYYELVNNEIHIELFEVPKETIYSYDLGTYYLDIKMEKVTENHYVYYTNATTTATKGDVVQPTSFQNILDLCAALNIDLRDACYLSELVIGKNLLICTDANMSLLASYMREMKVYKSPEKLEAWLKILSTLPKLDAYQKISYPFFFETLAKLQEVANEVPPGK